MSFTSGLSGISALPASGLPAVNAAVEPASIRNGGQQAQKAYDTGMAFEDILVNELAQEMTATVPGLDGSDDGLGGSTDDSAGSDDGSTGGLSGDSSSLGAYSSLLPQTLSSSIMSSGGTGIAMEIAKSIDPALDSATSSSPSSAASDGTTGETGSAQTATPTGGASL